MNERIQKLAEQAGISYVYLLSPSYPDPVIRATPESIEKFLKLIVEESVKVADDYVKDCLCKEHIKCNSPRSIIGIKIKERFGVEE